MSDLLESASAALGAPRELVQRSAAARAAVSGASIDDILAAWAGDAPPPAPAAKPAGPEAGALDPEPEAVAQPEAEAQPAAAAVAVAEEPIGPVGVEPVDEPDRVLEPVSLGTRLRTAVRIGAWTGAALGVVGFLVSSSLWAPDATTFPDSGPLVQVTPISVIIAIALVSVVFGAIVAGVSRAATAWTNPAMQLSGPKSGTVWLGSVIGLVLGFVAGAMLNGFGTAVENSDPPLIQLPVLTTLLVMILGGAVLGAITAMVPQLIGVPVALEEEDTEEVETVKTRLRNALSIPLAGVLLLVMLVLPFGLTLIQSNELAPGVGGAVVAMITAAGILGFAALAGSRPEMRISIGDFMVAIIGIAVILILILSVLFANRDEDHGEPAGDEAAIVHMI